MIWNTLQAGDEGTAQEALELFIEVAEAHPRFLRKNLTEIVNAMLQVGSVCNRGTPDVMQLASGSYCRGALITGTGIASALSNSV